MGNATMLTRFIFNRRHIKNDKIQYAAYIDSRDPSTLSVFDVTKLLSRKKTQSIWKLAILIHTQQCKGRGDLAAGEIRELCMGCGTSAPAIYTDPMFHPKHVNIAGFPMNEALRQSVAQTLAAHATLYVPTKK